MYLVCLVGSFVVTTIDLLHEVLADLLSVGRLPRRRPSRARRDQPTTHHPSSSEEEHA